PLMVISETLLMGMESESERLKRMGLLTPESKIKVSSAPLISTGIMIRLLISSNLIFSNLSPLGNRYPCAKMEQGTIKRSTKKTRFLLNILTFNGLHLLNIRNKTKRSAQFNISISG